ncbi:substrate-binding domain-containing protein [Paenibacillus hexagrammi]|uniref:Substrate-binding domain-containing protein n=1 Tax=Paenibacillus hexagrammi TaxID=2908839 RepID=A0ABY3SBN1_9BACL|nr:substrate-binding domain-containing protein [Paenibacillus sp. YPD9-1]UJF31328.1 substrate-binding domain-containing protein [Paenibacillus sp. YPD9-1]
MKAASRMRVVFVVALISLLVLTMTTVGSYMLSTDSATDDQQFLIGISQPNLDEPRQLFMNNEIRKEAEKHSNVRLIFTDAAENSEKQIYDVEKLMQYGIDLLIISLNDSEQLTPIVTEAYKSIPVIVLGRGVTGYDYSLFIGPDNESIGRKSAQLASELLKGSGGDIIEIEGVANSTSVEETSRGFNDELERRMNKPIVKSVVGDWQRDKAEDEMLRILPDYPKVRLIFAHSDAMALGASRAIQKLGLQGIHVLGIDGLDTIDGGFELVKNGILSGSVTSPIGGKEAVQYALDILHHEKGLPKKIILRSHLITGELTSGELSPGVTEEPAKESEELTNAKKIVLGVAVVGNESSWRNVNTESIREAAEGEKDIELVMQNAQGSQEKQIQIIRNFIARKVDAIAFSPIVETGWDEVLKEAKDAGIPILLTDRKVKVEDDSLWTTFIGSDFIEEGRRAARWLVEREQSESSGGRQVNIVELQGTKGSAPAIERKKGFEEVLSENEAFHIVASEIGDFTLESGQQLMEKVLRSGIKPDVVFAHNDDMALGAIKALEQAGLKPGTDIQVLSVDATRVAFQAMIAQKLNMSVECNPLLGPQIMKAVKDLAAGKEIPLNIITAEGIFTQETAKREFSIRKY